MFFRFIHKLARVARIFRIWFCIHVLCVIRCTVSYYFVDQNCARSALLAIRFAPYDMFVLLFFWRNSNVSFRPFASVTVPFLRRNVDKTILRKQRADALMLTLSCAGKPEITLPQSIFVPSSISRIQTMSGDRLVAKSIWKAIDKRKHTTKNYLKEKEKQKIENWNRVSSESSTCKSRKKNISYSILFVVLLQATGADTVLSKD